MKPGKLVTNSEENLRTTEQKLQTFNALLIVFAVLNRSLQQIFPKQNHRINELPILFFNPLNDVIQAPKSANVCQVCRRAVLV